jgi:hypothetical protein
MRSRSPLRLFSFLLALAAGMILVGCASTSKEAETDPNGDTPSNIPWNKPASWEGTGTLGGMMGH